MKKILLLLLFPVFVFAQNKIQRYQYWFDDDFAGRVTTGISPVVNYTLNTNISAAALNPGLHVIHVRFQDQNNKWSSSVSQFFQKLPNVTASTVNIIGYEYWFDNNFAGRVYTAAGPQQGVNISQAISASALTDGLHIIHFRFRDNNGKYSSVVSQFFHKVQNTVVSTHTIVAWQYWYDNDFANASLIASGPSQSLNLVTPISAASLNNGLHVIHFRFLDNSGVWSSAVSQFFHKSAPNTIPTVQLDQYQYWYDNDFVNVVTTTIAPVQNITLVSALPASGLADGLHVLHLRFGDNNGKWSSVISQFFHKSSVVITGTNTIVEYRYWYDTGDSAMITNSVAPAHDLTLNTTISLVNVPHGIRILHFQFRDSLGKWSSVLNDSVLKLSVPIALFSASDTVFCDSGSVIFSNFSIDGDTYLWDFGDASTSTLNTPSHQYNAPGLYTVSLTVTDTSSGRDSTTTYTTFIEVYATPSGTLSVSTNDSICAGSTATISAQANQLYAWSTGANTSSITTGNAGDYFATISNAQFAGCSRLSDTIHLIVMPLPVVNLGSDTNICAGTQLTLNASNNGATYNWSTGASSATIIASSANSYWVNITSSFGCVEQDTITIGVDPVPVSAFTWSVNNMTATFTNGSSSASTYDWDFGDAVHSSASAPVHAYTTAGAYTVTLIAYNACGSDTSTQVITITGIGSIANGDALFSLYPNPAVDMLNIRFASATDGRVNVEAIDIAGKRVLPVVDQALLGGYINTWQMPVGDLANGSYFVVITMEGQRYVQKFVVMH